MRYKARDNAADIKRCDEEAAHRTAGIYHIPSKIASSVWESKVHSNGVVASKFADPVWGVA